MKRILLIALTALFFANTAGYSEDVTFKNVKLADAKGKETDAKLVFSDTDKSVVIHINHHDDVSIPYANLDKLSYEYTKKHRIKSGAIVMALSPGTGALLMISKRKINWLYIDYHDKDANQEVVLELEKKDVQTIFQAAKDHTGKEVVDLGNVKQDKSKKSSGM